MAEMEQHLVESKENLTAMKKLHSENCKLSTKMITESLLADDDKVVKCYIGLPSYELLKTIIEFVIVGLPSGFFASVFEQYLIVLIKLGLNHETKVWPTGLVSISLQYPDISINGLMYYMKSFLCL